MTLHEVLLHNGVKAKRGSGDVPKDDGVSERLDGITISEWKRESIKAFGNAIVPQVAYEIFKSLDAVDWHLVTVRCLAKLKNSVGIVRLDFSISVQALVIGSPFVN